ncbi:hypothetical protein B0T25DRAFT_453920 [Lasiosphaeria hispida]|uniref:Protein kinase domain-containing protein n=1 Tax=Lasiosphaeria hispida TaxID=260671 RepID=A0AAJ0MEP2_9PEZI|nr:hypothetical protein B0T25DRAFT_453920 [Lasiosphaeria hispida]
MEAFENLNDKNSNQSRESPKHLDAFRHAPWSYRRVSMFFQQQWSFLAPVFTTESFQSFKLHSRAIFPFIYLDTGRRSSFFSDVYKVKIHPDHIKGVNEHIAVKELRSPEDLTREFDLDKSFETETHALDEVSALRHPNLVSAIAVIERANKRFFLFPWAGGGNLREFWADNNIWPLTPNLILLVLEQLHGLCDALTKIHGISWRHGDVKPENILRFGDDTVVGNLRLGDLGLAKKHDHDTGLRHEPTETRVGTVRYEPPEAVLATNAPRSRRYDIWSMGCIILEFIIWLQYGPEGLRKFTRGSERYFTITSEMGKTRVELHHVVQTWLDHMRDDPDWPEGTALGDLVQFVRTRMLVVIPAPPIRSMPLNLMIPSSSDDHLPAAPGDRSRKSESRVDSNALSSKTLQICGLSRADEAYLFPDAVRGRQSRRDTPTPKQNPTSLDVPPDLGLTGPEDISPLLITRMAPRLDEYRFAINVWEFEADNQFALSFAKSAPDLALPTTPKQSESLRLCDNCRKLDVCNPRFHVAYKASYLENNTTARRCDLCTLLYNATAASNMPLIHVVDFKKMGSVLFVNEGPPVLSIVAELEAVRSISFSPKLPPDIQLSYSTLPDPRSAISAQLVREWVRSCDTDHQCMSETTVPGLPKRLLSTNYQVEGGVRLCNTAGMDPRIRYTALSFCWGNKKHVKTTMSNITEFEQGIEYNQLDKTFQDAILVTHQLGIQYLWLDMFCIIQDSYEDLFQAVREIGTYFNNAYCVLVASSAPDPTGGLLMPRRQRKSIPIQEVDGVPISICELVDDFQKDVIASPHASRAWTLQERVLARRTIFFTATQMYWQCGEGIRCETLIKMHNPLASIILGSSNFPESALKRMSPIRVFTELYEHYSRLLLTYQTDRALALMSLESRLLQALGTAGGYGVLERFLGQSLLWRGDSKDRMARIDMPSAPRRPVPSWSWMAYTGGITYFAVPPQFALGSVKAFFDVLDADLTEAEQRETLALDGQTLPFAISYPSLAARTLKLDRSKVTTIFYDLVRNEDRDGQECVIVGTSKGPQLALYLLIVAPIEHSEEYRRERLGVGYAECDDMASFGIPESLVEIL